MSWTWPASKAMLEDARARAAVDLPDRAQHGARHLAGAGDRGRRPDPREDRRPVRRWPEAMALGEKMDFVPVAMGDERSHAIIAAALKRNRPVSGHVYGRDFVAAYAASASPTRMKPSTATSPTTCWMPASGCSCAAARRPRPGTACREAIKTITELGASHKRIAVCTDDRDADDLLNFGLDWVVREAVRLGMSPEQAWAMGSLHGATRFGLENEIGGLGGGRRADLVLLGRRSEAGQHLVWRRAGGRSDRKITPRARCRRCPALPLSGGGLCTR
jgi:imidazolonepropionase-like amidohydrolase